MDVSVNAPIAQAPRVSKWVWFEGSTALLEGQGVCYNWDYGTAANAVGARGNRVELPSITNAQHFAGVAARNYAAKTGGQFIEINVPGSVCNILAKASATIGVGRLTCEAGGDYAGYFRYSGFSGQGSAVPLQTCDRSTTAGTVLARLEVGEQSGLVEVPTLDADGGAHTFMVGGMTVFDEATTLAADVTFTLADSTVDGLRKGFKCMAAMTGNDIVITVTSGIQGIYNADPTTALATITLDADDEECFLYWGGTEANGHWVPSYALGSIMA